MSLEKRIEELERELEIKKAFLAAKVTFGNSKIDKKIKDLVSTRLLDVARQLAEEQELKVDYEPLKKEDIDLVKVVADSIRSRKTKPKTESKLKTKEPIKTEAKPEQAPKLQEVPNQKEQPLSGRIMTLDNVDPSLRMKLMPNAKVTVQRIDSRQQMYHVKDQDGYEYWVPMDDIELSVA